jgi:hypothetical protein
MMFVKSRATTIAPVKTLLAGGLLLLGACLCATAIAGEHSMRSGQVCSNSTRSVRQLAMIDHTSDGGYQCLGLAVDGDAVKAIRLERHSFAGNPGAEQIKVVEYPVTTEGGLRGAVIDGVPGHDAIVLRGNLSAEPGRPPLVISYLYNGITGEYHSCPLMLDRTANAGWRLVNRLDQPISLIGVKLRELPVIGVVGIANLDGACA